MYSKLLINFDFNFQKASRPHASTSAPFSSADRVCLSLSAINMEPICNINTPLIGIWFSILRRSPPHITFPPSSPSTSFLGLIPSVPLYLHPQLSHCIFHYTSHPPVQQKMLMKKASTKPQT